MKRPRRKGLTFWQSIALNIAGAIFIIGVGLVVIDYMKKVGVEMIQNAAKPKPTPTPATTR